MVGVSRARGSEREQLSEQHGILLTIEAAAWVTICTGMILIAGGFIGSPIGSVSQIFTVLLRREFLLCMHCTHNIVRIQAEVIYEVEYSVLPRERKH